MPENIFTKKMLRKYSPSYYYNPFRVGDIEEVSKLIEYAKGLVIKDVDLANSYETDRSLKAADRYIRAVDNTLKNVNIFERNTIIKNYTEYNSYYKQLQSQYNIDPYKARKANDREIISALYSTLTSEEVVKFHSAYYDTVNYYLTVTHTKAFNNQDYNVEFFNMILVFSAILKYINKGMEGYFDVDSYTRDMLKNGFISWGLDYFDDVPLSYQRRIYKSLNDLIRLKGSNEVFDKIFDIFSFDSIKINRYILAKNKTGDDLIFFRTPINEDLDAKNNEQLSFETITGNDPYWRADKAEILKQDFNPVNSKYISADITMNIVGNSKNLSYFYSLLNEVEILNQQLMNAYKLENPNSSDSEAYSKGGILDSNFYFKNENISNSPIYVYDALIALTVLIFKRMDWTDEIHRIYNIDRVYGYNLSTEVNNKVIEARKHLFWEKSKYSKSVWNNLMDLLNEFKIKGFDVYDQVDWKTIIDEFNSTIVYTNQLNYVADYITEANKTNIVRNHLENDRVYDALEYLNNVLLNSNNNVDMSVLFKYTNLQELLSKFIDYQINIGYLSTERIYTSVKDNEALITDLKEYTVSLNNSNTTALFSLYNKNKTNANLEKLLDGIDKVIEMLISKDLYNGKMQLKMYKNLFVFLNTYASFRINKNKVNNYTVKDFADVYYFNEGMRTQLEEAITSTINDPTMYNSLLDLWETAFVTDFDMSKLVGNKTFGSYLQNKDPNLYYYTTITNEEYDYNPDNTLVYRDKVLEMVESLDNYLNLNKNFFMQNNFISVSEYIKNYIYTLIRIFKSYTTETVSTESFVNIDDKIDNTIRVLDQMNITKVNSNYEEYLDPIDSVYIQSTSNLDEKMMMTEGVVLKITDGSTVTTKTY